ncbi:glycosyltransferase family 4 protein [Bradyrhizobium sp. 141]|uniref:glycosyltransferase family 4 protein n=1 Tax=Bradyrhizobium sp. 141 TaxID=2782617 RepID=UPI001FF76A9B|nr:glycosyltransferase family 4 protein [Bradyrhizobium sp. 141]MCK1722058.1 glycosyltransferase family 4 protein [Bradyrhizobium sp. 141]
MMAGPARGVIMMSCEYPPFPGGIGTYAGGVVAAVRRAGYPVTVIAPSYPELPAGLPEPNTHRILGHHRVKPKAVLSLLSILRRTPHDSLLLAADIRSVLVLYVLKSLHRRAYRVMVHGSEASKFRAGSLGLRLARRAYMGAELVAYNSVATQQIFHQNLGQPRREAVTYLGVEPHWFDPIDGGFENPALQAIPAKATLIVSVGRLEPRKGQLETVRAIARARDQHGLTDPVYVIAGRPEAQAYADAVRNEAERLSVRLVAPGRISDDDLKRLYRRAACHCLLAEALPGKIEGFGLVLLEAAAQECPSVATRVGGIPEVVGEAGVIVLPGNCDAAAAAISRCARENEYRMRLGLDAKRRAADFSWDECARLTFPELDTGAQQ